MNIFGRVATCARFLLLPAGLLVCTGVSAQGQQILDWPAFRSQVLQYHPAARQAELFRDRANAGLLRARGGFDPKVYGDVNGKDFNGKNYFQYSEAGVKWPLWLGLELKGNYNVASGDFLNPESKLPDAGQVAAGFNWTLGQGLLMDERRAALQEGRIGLQQNEAERAAALNDLMLEAAKAYWNWVFADNQLSILQEAQRQAQLRYEGIVESFLQGDKPAIDTLEAFIQVQNRTLEVNFARVDQQNALLALNAFLWGADGAVADLDKAYQAELLTAGLYETVAPNTAETVLQTARTQHPELQLYDAKLRLLNVERRLKQEKLKPVVDVNYQLLGNGWSFFPTTGTEGVGVLANDIKWGLSVSYPIPNRKARGDVQLNRIKIAQTDLSIQQKRLDIESKVRQYLNEMNTLSGQIELYRDITANYRALLDGEMERFRFGESSVFLVNTREQRWLDAQIKYLKLLSTYRKAEVGLRWSAGQAAQ